MNAATEFDLGPLTWVKGEIDLALERAAEALGQHEGREDVDGEELLHLRATAVRIQGSLREPRCLG